MDRTTKLQASESRAHVMLSHIYLYVCGSKGQRLKVQGKNMEENKIRQIARYSSVACHITSRRSEAECKNVQNLSVP